MLLLSLYATEPAYRTLKAPQGALGEFFSAGPTHKVCVGAGWGMSEKAE